MEDRSGDPLGHCLFDPVESAVDAIVEEVNRQHKLAHAGSTSALDESHSKNDWIAIALAYLGRASSGVFRNDREKCDYRENLTKAAAIIVSAIAADMAVQHRIENATPDANTESY